MNYFSDLDLFYPCGPNRVCGEVISIQVEICRDQQSMADPDEGPRLAVIHWKRKAWYVDASVNAFHLHRGLCREFREVSTYRTVRDIYSHNPRDYKVITKLLARGTMLAYRLDAIRVRSTGNSRQYYGFTLTLEPTPVLYLHWVDPQLGCKSFLEVSCVEPCVEEASNMLRGTPEKVDPRVLAWEIIPYEFVEIVI